MDPVDHGPWVLRGSAFLALSALTLTLTRLGTARHSLYDSNSARQQASYTHPQSRQVTLTRDLISKLDGIAEFRRTSSKVVTTVGRVSRCVLA